MLLASFCVSASNYFNGWVEVFISSSAWLVFHGTKLFFFWSIIKLSLNSQVIPMTYTWLYLKYLILDDLSTLLLSDARMAQGQMWMTMFWRKRFVAKILIMHFSSLVSRWHHPFVGILHLLCYIFCSRLLLHDLMKISGFNCFWVPKILCFRTGVFRI